MRPDLFIKTPSFIGQRERTRGAPQQPRPHALFQPRQCAADTRGRHSQGFRGPRDGPRLDHSDEHRQSRKQLAVEGHMIPDQKSRLSLHKRCCSTNADAGYCFPLRRKAIFKGAANMYAVTGITGKVGAAVARSLLSADQRVRAVVRDRAKGAAWADLGCDIAVADIGDAAALAKAFEGMDGVFAMLPPVFDPSPGFPEARAFIASMYTALAAAKPKKVVALSTIGADAPNPNLLNVLGLLEDALKQLP